VFGVSSDEYLNYALSNRREWERQGKEVVAEMSSKYLPPLTESEEADDSCEDEAGASELVNCSVHGLPMRKPCEPSKTRKLGAPMKMEDFDDAGTSTEFQPRPEHALPA
jgi:hypothetical protein